MFDHRDDIGVFHEQYQIGYQRGWPDLSRPPPTLAARGAVDSLMVSPMFHSSLMQAADIVLGSAFS